MLGVEAIAKIRRAHFVDGKSIKLICRELRLSRNTVRKVIRSGATEFTYDRSMQPRPKIDPWRSELDEMLADNPRRPKRERLTLVRICEELRNRGCPTLGPTERLSRPGEINRNPAVSTGSVPGSCGASDDIPARHDSAPGWGDHPQQLDPQPNRARQQTKRNHRKMCPIFRSARVDTGGGPAGPGIVEKF
jgi:hypothetical protein